jgi:K+-transporting ATPase ATPase C chain
MRTGAVRDPDSIATPWLIGQMSTSEHLFHGGPGLDAHISAEYVRSQIERVSQATGLSPADLEALIVRRAEGRFLGVFGEQRVNVLLLNLDVERLVEERRR